MIRLSNNFLAQEFYCPCLDCKRNGQRLLVDQDVVDLLQQMRDIVKRPIYVMPGGGVRCRRYNKQIGGYPHSYHLTGQAADVSLYNGEGNIADMIYLAELAKQVGFLRIGTYPHSYSKFIHCDVGRAAKSESWIRDNNGIYHYYDILESAIEEINHLEGR